MIIEIRDQCEGRENASDHVTTNLGFAFEWLSEAKQKRHYPRLLSTSNQIKSIFQEATIF